MSARMPFRYASIIASRSLGLSHRKPFPFGCVIEGKSASPILGGRPPFPTVVTAFQERYQGLDNRSYAAIVESRLEWLLPKEIFQDLNKDAHANQIVLERLNQQFPCVSISGMDQVPCTVSLFLITHYRPNASKFFFEMASRWLVPGKRLNVLLFYAVDFYLPELSNERYTLVEVMLRLDNKEDLEKAQKNLPLLRTEICLGAESPYHASRILELKGLTTDEKTAMIQENIRQWTQRRPFELDGEVFTEMQQFLVLCPDAFKIIREYRHMSRIICVHALFRKELRRLIDLYPDQRHLKVKLAKTRLINGQETKQVLGVILAVNILGDGEVFSERHILRSISQYVPGIRSVPESFFSSLNRVDPIRTLYLEVEKENGEEFSLSEIKFLRKHLGEELKSSVEHLLHPIFMPRNEEEIMRNILTLSQQLKYAKDIPQIVVSFDTQTETELSFTVILLRLLRRGERSLAELLADSFLVYVPDRVKIVGFLRNRYPKEAGVFHVNLQKVAFLRADHTVDLYRARWTVVTELTRLLGDVRDYNGGMITKQNELLCSVKTLLGSLTKRQESLFENFFYSINPVVMSMILPPETLCHLFFFLLELLEDDSLPVEGYSLKLCHDPKFVYALVMVKDEKFKNHLQQIVHPFNSSGVQLGSVALRFNQNVCLGYIFCSEDVDKQQAFQRSLERAVVDWHHEN